MNLAALLDRAAQGSARVLLTPGGGGTLAPVVARLQSSGVRVAGVIGEGGTPPEEHPRLGEVAELLRLRKPERVRDGIHALDLAADPLRLAAGLVALGAADALVVGPGVAVAALADVAEWTLGPSPDGAPIRAVEWLALADGALVALADCALAGDLTPGDRVPLALAVAMAHDRLGDGPPRVAFLDGSLGTQANDPLEAAVAAFASRRPGTPVEANRASRFRGSANVLIFPGGAAGQLALRTARALSGARLLGPLLLGPPGVFAGVADDADTEEVAGTVALAALIAGPAGT